MQSFTLLTPSEAAETMTLGARNRYLKSPVIHTCSEINQSLIHVLQHAIVPTVMVLYRDIEFDEWDGIDPNGWTIEVIVVVRSNEEVAQIEEKIEGALAHFPADMLLSEVISEQEFREFLQAFDKFRVTV